MWENVWASEQLRTLCKLALPILNPDGHSPDQYSLISVLTELFRQLCLLQDFELLTYYVVTHIEGGK